MPLHDPVRPGKRELRAQLLSGRAHRSPSDRQAAADALATRILALSEVATASCVTCYFSMDEEPGTHGLLAELTARGCTVLLPLLQSDFDLGWAVFEPGALRTGRFGLSEPTGPPLGVDAVTNASVVLCPGLAADVQGHRLGRGGGCYDRALSRLSPDVLRVALLYDDEVLDAVPTDDHDQRVHLIVTPRRTLRTSLSR